MHEALIKYIKTHSTTALTESDVEVIKAFFVSKKLKKKQYLLQQGEVCKYVAFIVKGAMRKYSVDDKGTEHTVELSIENWWVGDRESTINKSPSAYNIEAWEDTEILQTTIENYTNHLRLIPAMTEWIRMADERHAIAMQKRLNSQISLSAEKRYREFSKSHSEFIQRFPQHIIASYLGITKETLSRVRKPVVKK